MKKKKTELEDAGELRRRAEARFGARRSANPSSTRAITPLESRQLVHELQVHQIELEMQNEELQRARIEVEEGLSRYTDLYEFAPVGYLTLKRDGEIRQVNLTGARLLGLERSRLIGKRLAMLIDADSRAAFATFLNRGLANEGTVTCEVVVRPELGAPFAVGLSAAASAGGKECRVVASDITVRKRAEALLAIRLRLQEFASDHSANELLQKTLDEIEVFTGSQMGFFHQLESEQHLPAFQVWSTRTVHQVGREREILRSNGVRQDELWSDCVRKGAPIIRNGRERALDRKSPPNEGTPMIREVVVPIFRHERIVAVLGMGNKQAGYTTDDVSAISTLADIAWEIAERRRAENEREELQRQLAQAQKMEAIGTLASGIAHDFDRILVGVLSGLAAVQLDVGDDCASNSDIEEMKALVNRGTELTQQLLGFARLGKYALKPIDLAFAVTRTSAMYGRVRADVTIQFDLAPDLLAVFMDHSQLEKVLLNLLANAGQAMPEGGRILFHAENAELDDENGALLSVVPGRYVKLVVTDTGSGMDAKIMGRIFEPFFTTKAPGQGTGLGLASVYGIIKNHAGFIGVESELGKGTAFTLLLPATERQAAGDKPTVVAVQPDTDTALVVDDNDPKSLEAMSHPVSDKLLTGAVIEGSYHQR